MTRRRQTQRVPARPATPGFRHWTLQRATGWGVVAAACAFVLATFFGSGSLALLRLYGFFLAVTILCGASILWITAEDMRRRGTRGRMRAIRTFDLAVGVALLLPAAWAMQRVWPELGL